MPAADPLSDGRQLALFDMDGTLTDPADGILSCHRYALDQFGYTMPDDLDPGTLIGPPAEEAYALIGVPADRIAEVVGVYRQRFAVAGWLDDTPYDGIVDLVRRLGAAGWVLGVATMKLEPFAERILDRIGLASDFAVVAGSDTDRTRVSKRAVIEHALGRVGRAAAGTVMIGDRRHDVDAARSLGITAIGAGWGFGSLEELMGAGADAIALSPAEVGDLLVGGDR